MKTLLEYLNKGKTETKKYTWAECVKKMADWYMENIKTFSGKTEQVYNKFHLVPGHQDPGYKQYFCDLINDFARDNCTGFVFACLKLFGLFNNKTNTINKDLGTYTIVKNIQDKGYIYDEFVNNNWEILEYTTNTELKKFDILVGDSIASDDNDSKLVKNGYKIYNGRAIPEFDKRRKKLIDSHKQNKEDSMEIEQPKKRSEDNYQKFLKDETHHFEIYAGDNKCYGWGKIYDKKDNPLPVEMKVRKLNYIIRLKNDNI